MPTFWTRSAIVLFWSLISLVTYLLLMEQAKSATVIPYLDKVVHATLFAMLTTAGYFAYPKYRLWVYLGLMSYGAITELLQGVYTQTRHASMGDWMADVIGVLLCLLTINWLKSSAKRPNDN